MAAVLIYRKEQAGEFTEDGGGGHGGYCVVEAVRQSEGYQQCPGGDPCQLFDILCQADNVDLLRTLEVGTKPGTQCHQKNGRRDHSQVIESSWVAAKAVNEAGCGGEAGN